MAEGSDERLYRQQTAAERRAERRSRLLDAGLAAFGTRGYQLSSIEHLCGAAGVSTRNFYEEFRSKEDLLATLHDVLNDRAFDAAVAALNDVGPSDLRSRAMAGVRAYFKVMTSDPRWARIAMVESVGVSSEVEAHRRATLDRFASLIEVEADRLADAGVIPRRNYALTAIALVGAIQELVMTWTTRRDWDAVIDDVVTEAVCLIVAAVERR